MLRERWYWSDQQLLSAVRYMRLSYQPLIRRWRLYDGSQPFEGQGLKLALSSTFESLADAVQAMQRIVRWRIGSMAELPSDGTALLQLRFRIDLSHFPRPCRLVHWDAQTGTCWSHAGKLWIWKLCNECAKFA